MAGDEDWRDPDEVGDIDPHTKAELAREHMRNSMKEAEASRRTAAGLNVLDNLEGLVRWFLICGAAVWVAKVMAAGFGHYGN